MGKSAHQYYEEVIGKGFDEDGVYGVQCVDGFKHFCRTQLGYNISHSSICNPTGFATSIWDNFDKLGLGQFFDKVPSNQMVDGDWAIWSYDKNNRSCPYSHVAMFRRDNGDGTGVFLGQNQSGVRAYTQRNIYYDGLRGGMRPKIYHQSAVTPNVGKNEKINQIEVKVEKLRVRTSASLNGNIIGFASIGLYNFYEKKEQDGYVWYRIADNQWIASKEEWTNIYPAKNDEYVNIPPTIEERNIYRKDNKQQFATIKPKKFGGLTYKIYSRDGEFAEIETVNFGRCYVKVTNMTPITNGPQYKNGNY